MAGRSIALLLASSLLTGCSVHWGNAELKPAPRPPVHDRLAPDSGRAARLSHQLEQMLRVVERRLASQPPDAKAAERAALRDERLRIVVALADVRREDKRPQPLGSDVDTLLMDAAERIELAQKRVAHGWADDADDDRRDGSLLLAKPKPETRAQPTTGARGGRGSGGERDKTDEKKKKQTAGKGRRGRRGKFGGADDPLAGLLEGPGGAPPPDAKPAPAAAVVANSGPPPDVWPEVERKLEEVRACLAPEQREVGVALDVRVRIAADGSFRRVRVRAEPSLPAAATACVADVLSRIEVEPTGVSRVVRIPFSAGGR